MCRPRQPWEAADGAVYLLRELADADPAAVTPCLGALAEVAALRHFPEAWTLQETIWKQLPYIAQHLGKKVNLQPLMHNLKCVA